MVHLDDIVNFSETHEKHIDNGKHVLTFLQRAKVTLKFRKCSSFTNLIKYLEHVIRPRRLKIAAHTADSIQN